MESVVAVPVDETPSEWTKVKHLRTKCAEQPTAPRKRKKSIKRRARKRRICSCALRAQCRFICGGMQCPQRRRYRKKYGKERKTGRT